MNQNTLTPWCLRFSLPTKCNHGAETPFPQPRAFTEAVQAARGAGCSLHRASRPAAALGTELLRSVQFCRFVKPGRGTRVLDFQGEYY